MYDILFFVIGIAFCLVLSVAWRQTFVIDRLAMTVEAMRATIKYQIEKEERADERANPCKN